MTYVKPWVYNPRVTEEQIAQLKEQVEQQTFQIMRLKEENTNLQLEIDRLRELNNQFRIRLRIEEDNSL